MKTRRGETVSRGLSQDREPSASRSRSAARMWAGYLSVCLSLLIACSVGRHHTSDSRLEENFFRHEREFETLLADVTADERLRMIGVRGFRYGDATASGPGDPAEFERLGLPKERFERYQLLLRTLGLVQVTKGESGVEFRVDPGTITNGDSYKGYEYYLTPPEHQKRSLDEYRTTEVDRGRHGGYRVSKLIKGHWYLYLFVNSR
jgi:hypothetical protein